MEFMDYVLFGLCLLRFPRFIGNMLAFHLYKPIFPSKTPSFTSSDVTVVVPTLEGAGEELVRTLKTIADVRPRKIILSTIHKNCKKAEATAQLVRAFIVELEAEVQVEVVSISRPNKRRQMVVALGRILTDIAIFADDDVTWPRSLLQWILAPFDNPTMGGVATRQRLQWPSNPSLSQYIFSFLGDIYLQRRNFDCVATIYMDKGIPCLSGRTVAYRSQILQTKEFLESFVDEKWFGKHQNADDDNFITRWLDKVGWEVHMQYHPEAEVLTTLEDNPKFLKQCVRWARSNWRSNLRSLFVERVVWRRHLWSTYAVFLTTLLQLTLVTEPLMIWLCYKRHPAYLRFLLGSIFLTKFKLYFHYLERPFDLVLLPISIAFGYIHGFIKVYAGCTLDEATWGNRSGIDGK